MVIHFSDYVLYIMKKNTGFNEIDPEEEKKRIGIRLRHLRKSMGYTSHETFAYEHGFDRAQYGKYEAGSLNITVGTLIKILNKMKITLPEFFNEDYNAIDVDNDSLK